MKFARTIEICAGIWYLFIVVLFLLFSIKGFVELIQGVSPYVLTFYGLLLIGVVQLIIEHLNIGISRVYPSEKEIVSVKILEETK